ncbi:lipase maturation factor family protein [Salinibacterium sp. dk2585]|uniref:lipase maturation factor family protein n=1 Tax=unclassified Salinibacterium TaxID=2632331 RepID=UPI0011C25709|nr:MULTISPECIES: lipase maturation factor family protein [unclassified Salinibacterium]QEE62007.1 lipase maturation factor family protein [Salinibacterium sp. dk2585]TXK54438.1 lipase maturation factor family protein [Salinibacterium sp. dk5596]
MEWMWATEYELARQVLQRGVAAMFLVAFLSTFNQFPALLGERGLSPTPAFLRRVTFRQAPSIFHWHYSDRMLRLVCLVGALAAASVVVGLPQMGPPWVPLLVFLLMWTLYLSIVNVGQTFYGFGWESLLLEAGFIVAFLGSNEVPPPLPIIVLCWWLVFRLEFGAGMIKMRGGSEWRDLTALMYHHETQPMPGPLSRFAHLLPKWFHKAEVLGSHFAQLVVPWFLFAALIPHPVAQIASSVAAVIIIGTQGWLVLTGNFAWLNWLSIVLAFSAIADFPWLVKAATALNAWVPGWELPGRGEAGTFGVADEYTWFAIVVLVASAFLVVLSWRPLLNLFSSNQLMNASFNRYHLVNAYGAFGTVTKERYEIVIEGTRAPTPDRGWREYEFKGKPGDPTRVPRQFAPYHLRLDWLMWFLALGRQERWFSVLLIRLLEGDKAVLRLLRLNPFPDAPPSWVRARVFLYRFATHEERRQRRLWWIRTPIDELVGPVQLGPGHAARGGGPFAPSGTGADAPRSPFGGKLRSRHEHPAENRAPHDETHPSADGATAAGAPARDPDVDPDGANAVDVENPAGEPDPGTPEPGQDGARG